ncbi:MAG: LptA/OstA family protein [Verrucomicrobiota bacterium]
MKNFKFPRFGENGYTQWVLQGERGIYDSEEQIRVEEMALRVYSGDERMAKELTLDSPQATLKLKENRAFSEDSIVIEGPNFRISGTGWEWVGESKEIVVMADTVVEFTQAISGGLSTDGSVGDNSTIIKSDRLVLQTTETEYNFEFSGSVHAVSGEMDLKSEVLIALADAPKNRDDQDLNLGSGKLDTIKKIIAHDDVVILQGDRTVRSQKALFLIREMKADLSGQPQIEVAGAYLSGVSVRSQEGQIVIEGSPSEGRAQMILTQTGGLGIQGASSLSNETIVLADTITMREVDSENQFLFEGRVEVMSGAVMLNADSMTILANNSDNSPAAGQTDEEQTNALKVGEVRSMVAAGGVRIEQNGQVATGDKVVFYPKKERAVLTGSPKITNNEAILTGHRMELQPKLAIVEGNGDMDVVVQLPELPDLGYETFTPTRAEATGEGVETKPEVAASALSENTVVRSQLLRMTEEADHTLFRFTESVGVVATNLEATCERLDIVAVESSSAVSSNGAERLEVDRIEAHENVVFKQTGRTATAERAFILPQEGKVVLEEDAVVNDERGRVSGFRMTLLQGQRRAIVEGGGPENERARITLPAISGGGLD